ncbi:MAG TPA: hypothetical protein VFU99_07235 [Gaiellaceae bacterium]|nr:hypothetical protein [Gaiellaceae bacterium]
MATAESNPFRIAGELLPGEAIDRGDVSDRLFALAVGGHASRLVAPRRYGKTNLLRTVLARASGDGWATALVDLEGVLSLSSLVVRIERAYDRELKGVVRRTVDGLFRAWQVGLSLGAGGFAATLQSNPRIDVESVLLRLLDLPSKLHERSGVRSLVAFDEFQDLLRVDGADGILRSVLQHQTAAASYVFSGSAPTLMERLFQDPSRPLLEHAVTVELEPLSATATATYLEDRFLRSARDIGNALDPLLAFTRGHPQRTMLVAHHLWDVVPRGSVADESAFVEARSRSLASAETALRARWDALSVNEQRVSVALATRVRNLYTEETLRLLGLKKGSVDRALAGLVGKAEARQTPAGPVLTDPLLEHWLAERGVF